MADSPTRVLSLFSGIGGLDLGIRRAFPGSRVVAYVEREAFACEVLLRRMEEGRLDAAPIFAGDVRDLPAYRFRGHVDAVVAGFPCPPVSQSGRRRGCEDGRWLWPEVARVLRATSAEWCLVENVPGLLTTHAGREFGGVLADLARMGFDAEWGCVSAADVGAPHLRKRIFLLARRRRVDDTRGGAVPPEARGLAPAGPDLQSGKMDDKHGQGREGRHPDGGHADELPTWPPGPEERDKWSWVLERWPWLAPAAPESVLRGLAHGLPPAMVRPGVAPRLDMLRALGNAVVPAQAEMAFRVLYARLAGCHPAARRVELRCVTPPPPRADPLEAFL